MAEQLTVDQVIEVIARLEGRRLNRGLLRYYAEKVNLRPRRIIGPDTKRGRPPSVGYSPEDVALLRWMVKLSGEGVELRQFRWAVAELRRLVPKALQRPEKVMFFVLDHRRQIGASIDGRLIQLTGTPGQVLLRFPLREAADAVGKARAVSREAS